MSNGNLLSFPPRNLPPNGGNGNGEGRLRAVEGDLREIKADMKHVVTKDALNDALRPVQEHLTSINTTIKVLGAVIVTMMSVAGLIIAFLRLNP